MPALEITQTGKKMNGPGMSAPTMSAGFALQNQNAIYNPQYMYYNGTIFILEKHHAQPSACEIDTEWYSGSVMVPISHPQLGVSSEVTMRPEWDGQVGGHGGHQVGLPLQSVTLPVQMTQQWNVLQREVTGFVEK